MTKATTMRSVLVALLALLQACSSIESIPQGRQRSITLTGELTRADHQTYREIPFAVPSGVTSITVELAYNKDNRTVVDMGLRDPRGQRGWSGGNKSSFTITEFEATPSYMPGRIQPGLWRLVLGVPNIREGQTSHYQAKITFGTMRPARIAAKLTASHPVSSLPGWRRGDFHAHTAHSDGSCEDGAGVRGPCPLVRTLEAARNARLDFIAVTEHNTFSHAREISELRSSFPDMLVMTGEEITTFQGHANAIGVTAPLEFQLGSPRLPFLDGLQEQVEAQGGFLSINHPGQPSGEVCMGCGWTANTDYTRIAAVEAVNGASLRLGGAESATSGIPFWEKLLNEGHRITAIGGSDNHDATDRTGARQSPVGKPATVVWARELSDRGIIEGVRSGRAFIDISGAANAILNVEGRSGSQRIDMGGVLRMSPDEEGQFIASVSGINASRIELVSNGLSVSPRERPGAIEATLQLKPGARHGWVRANVRGSEGQLLLLGNPIYVRAR
jgi:hypothetical protein